MFGREGDWTGHEHVFSEVCHTDGYGGEVVLERAVQALYTDEWKYVLNTRDDEESLYRRGHDETAENDVAATESAVTRLKEIVQNRRANVSNQAADQQELSEDVRERLHRLGYVGE